MLPNLKILGIVGSLRRESHNLKLMRVAQRRMPGGAQLDIFTLEGIPPFNQDEEQQPPPKVIELKNA
ncbi:MAG TPA: NAD(P)H-dependent oxidoreductase, partial [Burkholderiales bacterium]|nr:NAD(P)H-dependent oxidoreductase [Burkholderiales bacterium]